MPADLMMLLPPYFKDIYEFGILMATEEAEMDAAEKSMEQVKRNLYVQTCDDMTLREYENLLGIVQETGTDLDYRRQMVLSRMNQQPPYSLPRLREILDAAVGQEGCRLEVRDGTYELELDVIDQPYQALKNIQHMVEGIIPAHLLFIFAGLYPVRISVDTAASSGLGLLSDFYARYNRTVLYLDGSWLLDGAYPLNGYRELENTDLYPVDVSFRAVLTAEVEADAPCILIGTEATQGRTTCPADMEMRASAAMMMDSDASIKAVGRVLAEPVATSRLTVEKDLWYLDGSFPLDGTKLLDAEIFEYEI